MTGDIWDLIHSGFVALLKADADLFCSLKYCRGSDGDERHVRDKIELKKYHDFRLSDFR